MGSSDCKVPAAILAIGTANPSNCIFQDDYPDFLFGVTNSEHLTDLKERFTRLCKKSSIKKRYFLLTEDILKQNPGMTSSGAASLNQRQDLATDMHPKLGFEAAIKAIGEWGESKSAISHLIFCSMSGVDMPGADAKLAKLLDLPPSINRLMLYNLGCQGSGTVLRIAKDIAENNPRARILAVWVESTCLLFQPPRGEDRVELLNSAILGDGAAAMIIGVAPPGTTGERPLFQIISASQTLIPGTGGAIGGQYREHGITVCLAREVPRLICSTLEACLVKAFSSATEGGVVSDWNSIFWVVHPGGWKVLDEVEETLGLTKERTRAARHVLEEYGNMMSATVPFILNEMRKRSTEAGKATTGDGLEFGVLLGFGPGITIETVVLHSTSSESTSRQNGS
ncbi:chalcone synthase-like [Rhodamnia argentea]|uniref:Chalcone synthase-like n=1 Tax=Rhodamnia argentea TaxID=178133 RepID=A0A8B8PKW5_9MYRT|nr:chalcone synthase-like [Rhodamnia argentea]